MMIIVFAVIAFIIYDYYKKNRMNYAKADIQSSPISHLETQLAKGEISEEEFVRKRDLINNK